MSSMNWDKVRSDRLMARGGDPVAPRGGRRTQFKPKGITNAQAKFLADLLRQAGEPWVPGLTREEASARIDVLLHKLGRTPRRELDESLDRAVAADS